MENFLSNNVWSMGHSVDLVNETYYPTLYECENSSLYAQDCSLHLPYMYMIHPLVFRIIYRMEYVTVFVFVSIERRSNENGAFSLFFE